MIRDDLSGSNSLAGMLWNSSKTEGYGNRYIDAYLKGDKEEATNIRQYMV